MTHLPPRAAREAGLAYVPEERMRDGAVGEFTVSENLMLIDHDSQRFSSRGFLKLRAIRERARDLVERFAVKTPSIDTSTRSLSGGNIQKLILARNRLVVSP